MVVVSSSDFISDIWPGQTALATLMLTNNESGALQIVAKVAARFQELQMMFHTDDEQANRKVHVHLGGKLG